jgi:hypothetical protein
MEFVDELPQNAAPKPTVYVAEANECRANPGMWGLLAELNVPRVELPHELNSTAQASRVRQLAHNIRSGRLAAFRPAGSFEAAVRTVTNEYDVPRQYAVYVRYVAATPGDDDVQ